jgi:predicted dehydrogenase
MGCGRIAQRHAEHINNLKNAELIAVCDIKKDRAKTLAEKYGSNYYTDIKDLLDRETNCDVLSVCTPNGLHAEHSIKGLEAGMNVLCEKPMSTSVKDCERMIQSAHKANKNLFIVKQNRFNPPIIALKNTIDEGRLGKILNVQLNCFWNRNDEYYQKSDWKGTKNLDGGTLYTQFSHFIDLILWLIGDVQHFYPMMKNMIHESVIEFEDTGVVVLEFKNGALGTINYTVNSYKKNMEGSITIFGEKGTIKIGGQYLNVLEYQSIDGYEISNIPESRPANEYGFYQGSMSNHDKVYQNVMDVLEKNGEIATNGEEGKKTVQLIEDLYNSINIKHN